MNLKSTLLPIFLLQPISSALAASPTATVTTGGAQCVYESAAGEDLGSFVGPGFVMRNVRVTVPGCPLTVYFRQDEKSERLEIIFELGTLQHQPADLGAYHVDIQSGGKKQAIIDVPKHYRWSRWRWQSAPRPIIAKVANLVAAKLLPPYTPISAPPKVERKPYTVMGLAGVVGYMPTTGEREDIGPFTEPQAEYIATGNPAALSQVLAQAEAAGTFPWHFRDEDTGGPVSYDKFPTAGGFWDKKAGQNDPWMQPSSMAEKDSLQPDGAHMPTLAYLPYLLTGDPYYLEELQFQLTYVWGSHPINLRERDKCILRYDQTREYAWDLRLLFQAAATAPPSTPKWLLPKAYFEAKLENNRAWFEQRYVNSTNAQQQYFRWATAIGNGSIGPWQEDFLATTLGLGVRMGYASWMKAFRWKIASSIARTDGKSGWPRAQAATYYDTLGSATTWAELASANHVTGGDDQLAPNLDRSYLAYRLGTLAIAVEAGVAEAREPYQWLSRQFKSRSYRWSFGIEN